MSAANGIISRPSKYSVVETLDVIERALKEKGVKVFARIDHGGEAKKAGLQMASTQLLIFGNPQAGTPVMIAAPTSAIDLPLKALAWEDAAGQVWLSYNDPEYLKQRFGLSDDAIRPIAGTGNLLERALD